MARHVWHALTTGSNLACEAGTGVGKSLAYLAPACLWVKQTRKRLAVSTYTRVLQSQLVNQDIPLLRRIIPETPEIAVAYGQENYLCLFRLRARIARGLFDTRQEAGAADRLLDWAETSPDGILLNISYPLPSRLRSRISRDSATCRRKDCPFFSDCYYYRARRTWEKSAILIINHSLFFAGFTTESDVLPDIDAVVFDEAHRLEDACVRHFGTRISQSWLFGILDSLSPITGRGLIHVLGHSAEQQQAIEHEVMNCRTELQQFFRETSAIMPAQATRLRLREPLPATPKHALNRLSSAVKQAVEHADDEHLAAELAGTGRRLQEAACGLTSFTEPDPGNEVQWIERTGPKSITLISAPLNVAPTLQDQVFPEHSSVIMTSATLTVAGSFDFLSSRLGLAGFQTLLLDSPFDHGRNSLLYVADKIPPPNHAQFIQAAAGLISDILKVSRGRALILFTSYDMMNKVRDLIPEKFYTHLCQGELSVARLLEQFRTDTHSVLFATQSFWQGIDVPGQSLSCLIICRLPFEVPDDPRLAAIAEQMREQGIKPFNAYQVPTAVLRFRQGFGRLIRTQKDRGVVCVLDRRILERSYGSRFLESLPGNLTLTTSLDKVARFLNKDNTPERRITHDA